MRTNDDIRQALHPRSMRAARSWLQSVIAALVCAAGWPLPASAQTTDVTVGAGVLAVNPELDDTDRYRDVWYNTGQIGLIVGRHVSTNLKVELELSTGAEGHQYVQRWVNVANALYPVPYGTERFSTLRQVSGSLVWQFFDNEWVHPFVQAGVAADVERVRSYTPAQTIYVGDSRLPASRVVVTEERREGPATTTTPGLILGGGAKFYASPRFFIRTDGRFTASGRGHHVALRLGLGIDF